MLRTISAVLCLMLGACSWWPREEIPRARPIRFPKDNVSDGKKRATQLVGKIAMVNEAGKFVLIETGAFSAPSDGAAVKFFHAGVEGGVLTICAERRGAYVVADVVTGKPVRGDEVFQ